MSDISSATLEEEITAVGEIPTLPPKIEENTEISSSAPSRRRLRNNNSIAKQVFLQPDDESPREVGTLILTVIE
jgi:hypothetical protein